MGELSTSSPAQGSTPNCQGLLHAWRSSALRSQLGNYDGSLFFLGRHRLLGIPSVVLSTLVGTSVFAALGKSVDPSIQIVVGLLSIAAAVLGALQTFLGDGDRAAKCHATAAEYGALKRQIDQLLARNTDVDDACLTTLREQFDTLARNAPGLPDRIWRVAKRKVPPTDMDDDAT